MLLFFFSMSDAKLLCHLFKRYWPLRLWLLRCYCHRTGWHCRVVRAPLSRLRSALSRLWQEHPPDFAALGRPRLAGRLISITLR
jgi:hypothetical protein